ncbi:unnamed protein product [Didymodactylos carnosus]|uniref:DNA replication complex GINS protein PSF3 n=1 Tax=Didymodactylos carnosus TaxID=1234261 RepID=A0A813RAF2_9BILA|nr:unnamed protein product [Didymodactylos carnosus]CAF0779998.1 unnamed protein product [Didymodactylos carnosus]CAF3561082.1 unnamed protein product [Didymodactylos carnosus]CAF3561529.1 unnamed protein product [Didymodactylos carnosus]
MSNRTPLSASSNRLSASASSNTTSTSQQYEDYFSIDDILSTQERIKCQLLVDVPKLGYLEHSGSSSKSNDDQQESNVSAPISAQTKLEFPYWMVYSICNSKTNFSTFELPYIFQNIQRQIFHADSTIVDLHKLSPNFYRYGKHLLQLNFDQDEKKDVAMTMLSTFQQRFRTIMDYSFHLTSSSGEDIAKYTNDKFISKFDHFEKQLFAIGQMGFLDYDRLLKNETKKMVAPGTNRTTISDNMNDLTNLTTRKRKRNENEKE